MTELGPFAKGFFVGAGLIIAIGAQNAFVLSQGITRKYNGLIPLVCSLIDCVLIMVGVMGMGLLISQSETLMLLTALGGALFLTVYSLIALRSAFSGESLKTEDRSLPSAKAAVLATLAISLLNPHLYLDTVVLLDAIGGQYPTPGKIQFIVGACVASFLWFFSLSFGASRLAPKLNEKNHRNDATHAPTIN